MPIPTRRSIAGDIERLAVPVSASLEYAKVNSRNLWAAIDRKTTSELLRKSQTRNLVQETNSLRGLKQRCQTTHVFGLKPRCVRLVCTCSQEVHGHLSRGVPNERCFVPGVCLARLRPRGLAPHDSPAPGGARERVVRRTLNARWPRWLQPAAWGRFRCGALVPEGFFATPLRCWTTPNAVPGVHRTHRHTAPFASGKASMWIYHYV